VPSREAFVILQELKHATRVQHEQLEELVGPRLGFGDHAISLGQYRTLLQEFWGFYAPLEARIWARPEWQTQPFSIAERQKLPRLAADLQALGMSASQLEALPQCHHLPSLDSWPQVLGAMYVLEGATLGGQIIARHLKQMLGIEGHNGAGFFNSYGAQVGPMWQAFGAFLNSQVLVLAPAQAQEVIQAANGTFGALAFWLLNSSEQELVYG
jgi:heme oxygenase